MSKPLDAALERALAEASTIGNLDHRMTEEDIDHLEDWWEQYNPENERKRPRLVGRERRKSPRHSPWWVDLGLVAKGVALAFWGGGAILSAFVVGYQLGWIEGCMVLFLATMATLLFLAVIRGLTVGE